MKIHIEKCFRDGGPVCYCESADPSSCTFTTGPMHATCVACLRAYCSKLEESLEYWYGIANSPASVTGISAIFDAPSEVDPQ
jgi:hypothetical protein